MTSESAISYEDIARAAERLAGVANRTPVITSRRTDALLGCELFFKPENLQRTGAFKFRGAYNALSEVAEGADAAEGVVAFSSGNHAQAVALAARLLGLPATIVMPHDAPPGKRTATEGYGAQIVPYDRYTEDRAEIAAAIANDLGYTLVPPFNHAAVMAGQGTAGAELFADVGPLDYLYVCLGGGGLISGCATAARHLSPDCEVIGVEPAAGNDGQLSLQAGELVSIPVPDTIADGAQITTLGGKTFEVIQRLVSEIITVDDAQLVEAMDWMLQTTKLLIEPTGALAIAGALSEGADKLAGKRVGVILSGGNISPTRLAQLLVENRV